MTVSAPATPLAPEPLVPRAGFLERQWRVWRRKKIGLASLVVVGFLLVIAAIGPLIATHDPNRNKLTATLQSPSPAHYFGTDKNGRDIYSRVIIGARISVVIGFSAVAVGITLGSAIGLISGFVGGALDYGIQRVVDAVMALPGLVMLMALVSVLQPSLPSLIVVLSIWVMPRAIRVVRGEALITRELDYVNAARALGATSLRLMFRHILPNVMAPILIIASVTVGQAIMTEASLSFLGLGVPPPAPTWGNMLSGNNRQYMTVAPWLVIAPGVAISITVLAFNMFGDALRDVLDPRLRGS
ncbi:MAG: ABC transporter permease [Candidatus Rokubacteria bacterium]|nr:ABC transporter permease [Chloroflexota bacterium]MBM4443537.1 ABC transporter permease [Candidatus Rokubacteria bacterium]